MKRLLLPQTVSRAVDLGLWEPRRALDFASEDPDAERKATLCSVLLATGKLSETERGAALRMALNGVEALASRPYDRLQLLVGLSAYLDDGLLLSAVKITWRLGGETALAALAPRLTQPLWKQAFNAALALPDPRDRASALTVLGPHLPAELVPLALEAAFQLPETDAFNTPDRVICAMAPRLAGHNLERALLYSRFVNSPYRRAKVLAALAQRLEGERKGEAIRQAWESTWALSSEWERAEALSTLAPHLTRPLLERALSAAMALRLAKPRFLALKALAQRLRGAQRDRALRAAVEAIPQIDSVSMPDVQPEEEQASAVKELAPQLTGDVLEQCVSVARALESDRERSFALGALATQLSDERKTEVLGQALKAALTGGTHTTHIMGRLDGVIALAPQLVGDLAQRALDSLKTPIEEVAAAQFLPGLLGGIVWGRAEALAALAPQLTDEQLRHALEALERMESLLGEKP
jgi:hypothetical protein